MCLRKIAFPKFMLSKEAGHATTEQIHTGLGLLHHSFPAGLAACPTVAFGTMLARLPHRPPPSSGDGLAGEAPFTNDIVS